MPANEYATGTRRANTVEVGDICLIDMARIWYTAKAHVEASREDVGIYPPPRSRWAVAYTSVLQKETALMFPLFNKDQCEELSAIVEQLDDFLENYLGE